MSADSPQTFGSDESTTIPNIVYKERVLTGESKEPSVSRETYAESQLDKLPQPTGWRILIVPYTAPRMTKGGIALPDSTVRNEEVAATIGYVAALGPDAYQDTAKFPEGPWCKKGDYVLFGRYAGARIMMQGEDNDNLPLRLLNDDEVLGVISNPEDYVGVV
jgi:co-chaperonin GroES (HSP10)